MSPVFHFRWNFAKILSCPTYVIFPSPNQPCTNPSQFLNCISVLSYFHPRAHLPCASPSQFRCLLLNMRSADLKIQPSATTPQNTAETKSGKSWQKKWWQYQATLLKISNVLVSFQLTYQRGSVADQGLFGAWNENVAINILIKAYSGGLFAYWCLMFQLEIFANKKKLKISKPLVLLQAPFFSLAPRAAPNKESFSFTAN